MENPQKKTVTQLYRLKSYIFSVFFLFCFTNQTRAPLQWQRPWSRFSKVPKFHEGRAMFWAAPLSIVIAVPTNGFLAVETMTRSCGGLRV